MKGQMNKESHLWQFSIIPSQTVMTQLSEIALFWHNQKDLADSVM
jgi:hypothetical protein